MSRARSLSLSGKLPRARSWRVVPRPRSPACDNLRLILAGPVGPEHITALEIAERKHRKRFAHISPADESFQRKALAGADIFLVPGPTEPEASG